MDARPTTPLFVRIPQAQARALDRLAFETRRPKQAVVSDLLSRYIEGPDDRRVAIDTAVDAGDPRGRYAFWPDDPPPPPLATASTPEVLTLEEAARLLRTEPGEIEALAGDGAIPGRLIGGQWRFSRAALLAWLAHGSPPDRADG